MYPRPLPGTFSSHRSRSSHSQRLPGIRREWHFTLLHAPLPPVYAPTGMNADSQLVWPRCMSSRGPWRGARQPRTRACPSRELAILDRDRLQEKSLTQSARQVEIGLLVMEVGAAKSIFRRLTDGGSESPADTSSSIGAMTCFRSLSSASFDGSVFLPDAGRCRQTLKLNRPGGWALHSGCP